MSAVRARRRVGVAAVALLVAIVVLLLDSLGGPHSPLAPVRNALGTIASPFEKAAHAVASPFADLGGYLHSNSSLRGEINRLKEQNAQLQSQSALTQLDRSRIAEVDGLTGLAQSTGYTLLAANVIAVGPAQDFAQTITIDAGTVAGVHSDMTVVDADGLVGRVVAATTSTATVLLITDATSVVGVRVGTNLNLGTATGQGGTSHSLTLAISGTTTAPPAGSTVTTWGSPNGIPYVAGIPIGTITSSSANASNLSVSATITPFARMGSLDIVGVVVPSNLSTSRPLIHGVG